jgi:hypothetical protein
LRVEARREVRRSIAVCRSQRDPRGLRLLAHAARLLELLLERRQLHAEPVDERIAPLRELEPGRIGGHAESAPRQLGGLPAARLGRCRAQLADLHGSAARMIAEEAHGLSGEEAPPADRALVGSCSRRHRNVGW